MTLTVRLPAATEAALDRYCLERGVTKSLVVQESLAVYLFEHQASPVADPVEGGRAPAVSANYKAFADAGFIGAGKLGGGSADNAAVRAMAMKRIRRNAK